MIAFGGRIRLAPAFCTPEYQEKALPIAIEIGDRKEEGRIKKDLGFLFHSLGDYQKAKEHQEKALAIAIEIGDRQEEGRINGSLGQVFYFLGEYHKAKEYQQKALAIALEIGDREQEGRTYGSLEAVFHSLGEYQRAKEYQEKALAIAIEIGDRKEEGRIKKDLGSLFHSLGDYQKAKEYQEKALAIAIETGDRKEEGRINGSLGFVFYSLCEYQKAKEYQENALAIAIEIGNKRAEGEINGDLGGVFHSLGELQKAEEYTEKALAIAIEVGDRQTEKTVYGNLGNMFHHFGEDQKAKVYHEKELAIAIEIGDRRGEGTAYMKLASTYYYLAEYQKAKEYQEKALAIAIETGDKEGEGGVYDGLGAVFYSLCEYQNAVEYKEKALAIAIKIGDRRHEGAINGDLAAVFSSIGEHEKANEYHKKALAIAKETGDRHCEAKEYRGLGLYYYGCGQNRQAEKNLNKAIGVSKAIGDRRTEAFAVESLAIVLASVNDFQKAKEQCEKALTISRECGYRDVEAQIYIILGGIYFSLGKCGEAEDCLEKAYSISSHIGDKMKEFSSLLSITKLKLSHSEVAEAKNFLIRCIGKYEQIRTSLKGNSEFKISLLEKHGTFPYQLLTRLLCDTEKFQEALYVEELGRARVLAELMADKYSVESHISANPHSCFGIENIVKRESNSIFLYISYLERQVLLWVLKASGETCFRKSDEVKLNTLDAEQVCDVEGIFKKSVSGYGILPAARCEDRSLDEDVTKSPHENSRTDLRGEQTKVTERIHHLCYKWIVAPVADLVTEPEIIIVPDRFSYQVPFAALRDEPAGKYLSEKYRIRIVPSLTTLQHIQECAVDYHSQTGTLVVGDPTVGRVYYDGRVIDVTPLFYANKEARMVGELLGIPPLLGRCATKQAVLQGIPSVSLIHLAAHGNAERGEIALSPKSTVNSIPQEDDYMLTMSDILGVQTRAKLVVLSCCHSGRGSVTKEGVIGIARAFLASGARSVLFASWAIEDKATEKLMKHFYKHLVRGESASGSLQRAVQWLRSNGFPEPSQWAPFVLMGDNVTFDFMKKGKEELKEDNKEAKKGKE
ncbi:Tetratricopeptide repeat protein 28 [Stylophora pistillata]|uniref:Tetratricopeptide repeat protein 28 n=1 Tax=Stylophora pistillata TaxID=50429 RepID=A0A2B4SSF0_STYPI|nr:Tetratricopeptide repeat protein 28 [Stylophora pistillata]